MVYSPAPLGPRPRDGQHPVRDRPGFYIPRWTLQGTNNFICAIIDEGTAEPARLRLSREHALGAEHFARAERAGSSPPPRASPPQLANVWDTNRVGGGTGINVPMVGIENQMQIALGNTPVSDAEWRSYGQMSAEGQRQAEEH